MVALKIYAMQTSDAMIKLGMSMPKSLMTLVKDSVNIDKYKNSGRCTSMILLNSVVPLPCLALQAWRSCKLLPLTNLQVADQNNLGFDEFGWWPLALAVLLGRANIGRRDDIFIHFTKETKEHK
ncbi:hypothetical protein LIER_16076 [Lithospermum erythrorhizon]|uniref:Uncharacterized protein n=1 Tax=Lithospermum erythrorhizon TaxID=34254 RepID=A0AAV3Q6W0_LITER